MKIIAVIAVRTDSISNKSINAQSGSIIDKGGETTKNMYKLNHQHKSINKSNNQDINKSGQIKEKEIMININKMME
jgi:hypothetical protein